MKEEELKIEQLVEGEIYVAIGNQEDYLFKCTDINKRISNYIPLKSKKVKSTGDVNIRTNNFSQKYRRATYKEKQIWKLSIEKGEYTEPSKEVLYEIY